MNGLQKENIMACAKHFPGHGDTDVDSHKDLPVILHDRQRLDSIELYPFRELTNNGVSSMMVAHLNIPALDSTLNSPSTVSRKIVTGLLKEELGFNGLIFTDALQMKGITKNLAVGESSVKAFLAGNDVLLFPDNVKAAVNQMKTAYSKGLYSEADLNKSVKKILMAKQWVGIQQFDSLQVDRVVADLNTEEAKRIQTKLIEAAITVVRDSGNTIPIMALENKRIASITIGAKSATPFTKMLDNYENVDHFYLGKNEEWSQFEKTLKVLERYDYVLANTLDMSRYASKQYGISTNTEKFLGQLSKKDNAILTVFGSPYSLIKFPGWKELIVAYEASDEAQDLAAQVIFGGRKATGKLPISAGEYKFGEGKYTVEPIRLKYGNIRELGYSSSDFAKLDSIIEATLSIKATPGCQVLVAKNGQVIYERSFGRHTYDKNGISVKNSDLYDIASITKIVASTALVMKLVEDGKLDIDKTLGEYIDLPEGCNKKDLIIKEMLAHQSGLWPWIPFYLETLDDKKSVDPDVYQKSKSEDFPIIVCNDLYCSFVYQDSIWSQIHNSELRPQKGYKYSDLGFYYMMLVIEKLYQRPIEDLVQELLYDPMGMNKTTYLPLEAGFKLREIVPTETEKIFRGRTIHGYVHDPGAAMMGGIGGHAGIFSNANDLAKFMQMLLNGGVYGGRKYLDSTTIKTFTSAPYEDSRRGIGFDKPDPDGRWGSACASASLASFGHTGFTGTMAFADPENDLIFVFLSNRIHPTADNKKLITESSRTQMHQAIYDIFEK
ncbi:MAG: serine hydrolase [Chitinophagales bacterium]